MDPRICEETLRFIENLRKTYLQFTRFWIWIPTMPCRHALDHMLTDFRTSDENIRQHKTLSGETMLGKITTLVSMCPAGSQASILPRFFQRFCRFLSLHWETICNSGVSEDARWATRLLQMLATKIGVGEWKKMAERPRNDFGVRVVVLRVPKFKNKRTQIRKKVLLLWGTPFLFVET